MNSIYSLFLVVLVSTPIYGSDDTGSKPLESDELYPYAGAAFNVGWMPNLSVVEHESKLVERLGAQVFNLLREAEKVATELEVSERNALRERLAATPSHAGRVEQLKKFILESHERGRVFRESVDELVSPADREFIVRLRGTNFDTFDPWNLASIGADQTLINKVNETAVRRAQDWVSIIKAQQSRKLTAAESDMDDAKFLTKHRVEVLKLLTKEQQQKVMHVSFGLPTKHSKMDLSQFLDKRKDQFDSKDEAKKKALDELKEMVMSAIKYD